MQHPFSSIQVALISFMQNNIFIVTSRLNIGGVAKSSCLLANNLCKKGYNVRILRFSSEQSKFEVDDRIKVYTICEPDIISRVSNKYLKKIISVVLNLRIFVFLLIHKKSLFIAFRTDIVLLLARYKDILNFRLIGSERGNPYRFNTEEHKHVLNEYKKCDKIVFQTERGLDSFVELRNKASVIPNYCFVANTPSKNTSLRSKEIVACGVPGYDKGFDILIKSCVPIFYKYKEYKLLIYGPVNDYCKELKQLALESGISDNVIFKGTSNAFYLDSSSSAMFVLSSRNEGIPNALIEAMSVGLPCIATDCASGGPSLLLDNGLNGLLVPIENHYKLTEAILYFIEHKDAAEILGKRGKDSLVRFSEDVITSKWIDLIEEL